MIQLSIECLFLDIVGQKTHRACRQIEFRAKSLFVTRPTIFNPRGISSALLYMTCMDCIINIHVCIYVIKNEAAKMPRDLML